MNFANCWMEKKIRNMTTNILIVWLP